MKTLIHIKIPRDGQVPRVCSILKEALGVGPDDYFKAFNLTCKDQAVEHIITGGLKPQTGTWFFKSDQFPDEGTYFFNRIMGEVDCLLIVRQDVGNQLYLEVAKARLTSLEPGDSFVLPRNTRIGALFQPYNFAGGDCVSQ